MGSPLARTRLVATTLIAAALCAGALTGAGVEPQVESRRARTPAPPAAGAPPTILRDEVGLRLVDARGDTLATIPARPQDGLFGYGAAILARPGGSLLAVAAPLADGVGPRSGRVWVFALPPAPGGEPATLTPADAALVIESPAEGARFGSAMVGVPDANGDGAPDLLVGAPGAGRAFLVSALDGAVIRAFEGEVAETFGITVATRESEGGAPLHAVGAFFRDGAGNLREREWLFDGGTGELLARAPDAASPIVLLAGDLDLSGVVDDEDLARLLRALGRVAPGGGVFDARADLTGDGVVDEADLNLLLANFGAEGGGDDGERSTVPCLLCPNGECFSPLNDCSPTGGGPGDDPDDPGDGDPDDPDFNDTGEGGGGGASGGGDGDPPPPPPPDGPDGPQCSVTISDPPRAIGVWAPNLQDDDDTNDPDDLPRLTASGSPGGGTYTWAIVPSAPEAGGLAFTDPATGQPTPAPTGPTVHLLGTGASAALNDVSVKVTYTTEDGKCEATAMVELTVIMATLTFRPVDPGAEPPERWSPGNNIPQLPGLGHPELGPANFNSPEGTQGYFKNIEIEARIEPCVGDLDAAFDFKRVKQGYTIDVAFIEGQFFTLAGSAEFFSPPDWWDDDTTNADEDLDLDVEEVCVLYAVDSPGFVLPSIQCGQTAQDAQIHQLNCKNFREWLVVDGFRASRTIAWYASTEIECTPGGLWLQSSDFNGNRMGEGSLPCAPAPPLAGGPAGDLQAPLDATAQPVNPGRAVRADPRANDAPIDETLRQIESLIFVDRTRAAASLRSKIEGTVLTAFERAVIVHTLLQILDRETDVPLGDLAHPHLTAIELLGKLRAQEAALALVKHINAEFTRAVEGDIDMFRPAVVALWRIGEPAIRPIIEAIPEATEEEWRSLHAALRLLDESTPAVRREAVNALETVAPVVRDGNALERARRELFQVRLLQFLSKPVPRTRKAQSPLAAAR